MFRNSLFYVRLILRMVSCHNGNIKSFVRKFRLSALTFFVSLRVANNSLDGLGRESACLLRLFANGRQKIMETIIGEFYASGKESRYSGAKSAPFSHSMVLYFTVNRLKKFKSFRGSNTLPFNEVRKSTTFVTLVVEP